MVKEYITFRYKYIHNLKIVCLISEQIKQGGSFQA